jgi:hypothetical protein
MAGYRHEMGAQVDSGAYWSGIDSVRWRSVVNAQVALWTAIPVSKKEGLDFRRVVG